MNNNKKPTPLAQQPDRKLCPVCKQPSYSRDGIHPQCAIELADSPRKKRLAEEKKKEATTKKKTKQKSWNKKCPACHEEVHVRLKVCSCGHNFGV
jgi:hypothetical protein